MATLSSLSVDAPEAGASQAVKAQLRLREMILSGELPGSQGAAPPSGRSRISRTVGVRSRIDTTVASVQAWELRMECLLDFSVCG